MKYNQPFGISDPDAPYINGNPSTGTMGSIPPAASIEFPQREIANFITENGIAAPSNADLKQLAKGIQSNATNFRADVGVPNAVVAPILPVPDAYYSGMQVRFRAAHAPTGPATLDAGRGARPIRKSNGGTVTGSEWVPGDIVEVTYDSVLNIWQLPISAIAMLYAPRDFYVDDVLGLDTNPGTAGSPFKTIQRAANVCQLYNQNGYQITVHVANGGYAKTVFSSVNGSGSIRLVGNIASAASCIIHSTAGNALLFNGTGRFDVEGFRIICDAAIPANGDPGNGAYAVGAALAVYNSMEFGYCAGSQIASANSAISYVNGPVRVTQGAGWSHFSATAGSQVMTNSVNKPTYNFAGSCSYPAGFCYADLGSVVSAYMGSIAGYSNVHGQKYYATTLSVINVGGAGAASLPGDDAAVGTLLTGAVFSG